MKFNYEGDWRSGSAVLLHGIGRWFDSTIAHMRKWIRKLLSIPVWIFGDIDDIYDDLWLEEAFDAIE